MIVMPYFSRLKIKMFETLRGLETGALVGYLDLSFVQNITYRSIYFLDMENFNYWTFITSNKNY